MSDLKGDDGFLAHWKSLLACSIIAMCAFQFGLDFSLIGGLQAMPGFLKIFGYQDPTSPIGYNISTVRQQLISSIMSLGVIVASGSAGLITKFIGRKPALWIASILCLIADIIMMTTTKIGVLYFGRLVMGFSNGLFYIFGQLYIQECAPSKYRGMMIGGFEYWSTFGALIGNIVDNFTVPLGGKKSYIIPLGVVLIIPGVIAIVLLFVPESPRWLLQKNKEEKAQIALQRLCPRPELANEELAKIKLAIDAEAVLAQNTEIIDLWRNPVDRRRALLAIGAVCIQGASGASYIIGYSTYFFEMAGVNAPFQNTCIMSGVSAFVLIVNGLVITKYGFRRILLTWGMVLCGLSQLIMAAVYTVHPGTILTGKVIVGCSIFNQISYTGLISTYAILCAGEFPSQRLRSYTLGIAIGVGSVLGWVIGFTAPYFINPSSLNWGPKYGYIWAGACLIGAIWVWMFLPEVKGRTFEEINEMFEACLPARKFQGHTCEGSVPFAAMGEKSDIEKSGNEYVSGESKKNFAIMENSVDVKA